MSNPRNIVTHIAGIGELICGIAVFVVVHWNSGGLGVSLVLAALAAIAVFALRQMRRLQLRMIRQEAAFAAVQLEFEERLAQASEKLNQLSASVDDHHAEVTSRLGQAAKSAASAAKRINLNTRRLSEIEAALSKLAAEKQIPPPVEVVPPAALEPLEVPPTETGADPAAADMVQSLAAQVAAANDRLRIMERDADIVRSGVIEAVQTGHFPPHFYTASSFNPEVAVLPTIAEFVEPKLAFDVGANRGEFTAALRNAGFDVHAFEPLPVLNAHLEERFAAEADAVRIHAVACSDEDGSAQLHLAAVDDRTIDSTLFSTLKEHPGFAGFGFSQSIMVPVRRLDTIFRDGAPMSIGLLKTDTEGNDLAVLKGASTIDAAVLMVEFWDKDYVFNVGTVGNSLQDYLAEIDRKKYPYWIVMWRGMSRDNFGVAAGIEETPSGSWGNILFLSDSALADAVLAWARQTYGASRVKIVEKAT